MRKKFETSGGARCGQPSPTCRVLAPGAQAPYRGPLLHARGRCAKTMTLTLCRIDPTGPLIPGSATHRPFVFIDIPGSFVRKVESRESRVEESKIPDGGRASGCLQLCSAGLFESLAPRHLVLVICFHRHSRFVRQETAVNSQLSAISQPTLGSRRRRCVGSVMPRRDTTSRSLHVTGLRDCQETESAFCFTPAADL